MSNDPFHGQRPLRRCVEPAFCRWPQCDCPTVPAKPTITFVEPIPAGHARELHGRELVDALREHFGWHLTRRDELQALRDELRERELVATVPMRFDPIHNTRPAPLDVPAWEIAR